MLRTWDRAHGRWTHWGRRAGKSRSTRTPEGTGMNYEILGQLSVGGRAGVSAPRARKIETLLAVLLAKHNQVVTTEHLIGELWGENPPARASAALYVYVSQLRKLLRGTGDD